MMMRMDLTTQSKTKLCPFCAEVIQAEAIKCRFCNEILSPERIKAVEMAVGRTAEQSGPDKMNEVLFSATPSLWGLGSWLLKGFIAFVAGGLLLFYPIEGSASNQPVNSETSQTYLINPDSAADSGQITDSQAAAKPGEGSFRRFIKKLRTTLGLGIIIVTSLILLAKSIKLKAVRYDITADRIEWTRGFLAKKVDNIDMFRIVDMKFHRSFFDSILGLGTITLLTTDKSDPEFRFEKVKGARQLYDVIKKSSLDSDRRTSVVHLE